MKIINNKLLKIFCFGFCAFFTFYSVSASVIPFVSNDISGDNVGYSIGTKIADLDGDGDLDIHVARYTIQNNLWINDGSGNFTSADIVGDNGRSWYTSIGDLNGDTFNDIYVSNFDNNQNQIWINDGSGNFTANNIAGDFGSSIGSVIADFNGDTFNDIYVANYGNQQNRLWLNDGSGNFTSADIVGDMSRSIGVAVGDINGDTFNDIYVANDSGEQNKIWLNDGSGNFTSGDIVGDLGSSRDAIIADLNGDTFNDIYVANQSNQQNRLWLNDGSGNFTSADITNDRASSRDVEVLDIDNDGDNDLYVGNGGQQNRLWINNGSGSFTSNDITGDTGNSWGVTSGDVNGDGTVDIYVSNLLAQNRLWLNNPNFAPTDITLTGMVIYENTPTPAVVSVLNSTDPNPFDVHLYSIGLCTIAGADDSAFSIVNNNQLQIDASLNYSIKQTYEVCVRTDDQKGGIFDKTFTIQVKEVLEDIVDKKPSSGSGKATFSGNMGNFDQGGGVSSFPGKVLTYTNFNGEEVFAGYLPGKLDLSVSSVNKVYRKNISFRTRKTGTLNNTPLKDRYIAIKNIFKKSEPETFFASAEEKRIAEPMREYTAAEVRYLARAKKAKIKADREKWARKRRSVPENVVTTIIKTKDKAETIQLRLGEKAIPLKKIYK